MSKRPKPESNTGAMFETPPDLLETGSEEVSETNETSAFVQHIEADALLPGQDCPFTDGCRGKVRIFNQVNRTVTDPDTKKPRVETHQQLKCSKCGVPAQGSRKVRGSHATTGRFFNRLTGKTEQF